MSISLNANFELLSAGLYLDDRQQFNTIIEMKDFAETSIPDGFITYNKETQKHYVFSSSNTVDATLGKWREYNRGGGGSSADLILDTEVRIDKTYSSSKIYADIQQCLEDSKTYTLEEIARVSTTSYKVVTDVVDMTEEKYLYLLYDGTTNYDIYIVETDGTPTKIGNTQIDLSNYYTKTEIDNDFLKKVDADGKYATITTVDGKIDKDKIVTVLNDTVTNNQVASALLTKTELDKTNARLVQLETTQINKTSMVDMYPNNFCYKITPKNSNNFSKILIVDLYGGCILITGSILTDYKGLKAVRLSNGYWDSDSASNTAGNKIDGVYHDDSYIYVTCLTYMKINFEGGFTNVEKIDSVPTEATRLPILDLTQNKLNYSTVDDVSKTLTPLFPNGVKVASGGVAINYVVKNGWCNVNFKFNITSSTTFSWTDIAWGLPIPANSIDTVLMSDGKATQPIPIKITSTGSVSSKVLSAISTTDWWTGNISYPVAE